MVNSMRTGLGLYLALCSWACIAVGDAAGDLAERLLGYDG